MAMRTSCDARRAAGCRPPPAGSHGGWRVGVAVGELSVFADHHPLGRVVLERVLAGVSTRKYRRAQDPVGAQAAVRERSTSKSSVSRAFVERTREALWQLMPASSPISGWRW